MNRIAGIDPGLDGGLAVIDVDGPRPAVMPVATVGNKREIDERALMSWFIEHRPAHIFIERVQAMPKQGVVSMFNFGVGWGIVRGICTGMGISYELVRPQEWQKVMLAGQPRGSNYLVASRLWPHVDFRVSERTSRPHGGLVDAALIAEYGRRQTS